MAPKGHFCQWPVGGHRACCAADRDWRVVPDHCSGGVTGAWGLPYLELGFSLAWALVPSLLLSVWPDRGFSRDRPPWDVPQVPVAIAIC